MAATYEIREDEKGLVIISRRSKRSGLAAVWIVATALFFWFGRRQIPWPTGLIIAVFAIGWQIAQIFRGAEVELRITNLEFTTKGYFGSGYAPDRNIPRADVIRLDYKDGRGGGVHSAYEPSGLYLKRRWKTDCVLPDLDEAQTNALIDAIYKRFPDIPLASENDLSSIFGGEVIRLGLSESPK